jgi:hypothetical protein
VNCTFSFGLLFIDYAVLSPLFKLIYLFSSTPITCQAPTSCYRLPLNRPLSTLHQQLVYHRLFTVHRQPPTCYPLLTYVTAYLIMNYVLSMLPQECGTRVTINQLTFRLNQCYIHNMVHKRQELNSMVHVRFTEPERRLMKAICALDGIQMQEYIRALVLQDLKRRKGKVSL